MDIHAMMANAAADVRTMELRIVHLQDEVRRVNLDNERLRRENASITAARMHAEADLVHYQNVFVASVCVEAGSICREFFNLTQEKVRERAEGAIQKYVEERVKAEREKEYPPTPALGQSDDPDYEEFDGPNERELVESQVKPYSNQIDDPEDFREFDKSIEEGPAKPAEVQDTNTPTPTNSEFVQAPFGLSNKQVKNYYINRLGYLPLNWGDHPALPNKIIPTFLTEPKKEEPPTSFGSMLATIGL